MGLRPGQGSPRVSGSDQVDNDPMTTPRSSGVKLEDSKPLLRDREANTVKSGKNSSKFYNKDQGFLKR